MDDPHEDLLAKADQKDCLIEYLSAEIESAIDLQREQRTRNNFTVAVGPYILLGGYILAAGGPPDFGRMPTYALIVGGAVFLAAYTAAGWLSAVVEGRLWDQSNRWRRQIAAIAGVEPDAFVFEKRGLQAIYMGIYGVLGLVFLLVLYLLTTISA